VVTEKTTQAACAHVTLTPELNRALKGNGINDDCVAEVFVCSQVELSLGDELAVEVHQAHGDKCPRCWNWRELGEDGLCERCHDVMTTIEGQE